MMKGLLNTMRGQASMALNGKTFVRLGLVDSVDPGNYSAKVRIQPEDVLTNWLPIASPWVGNGWGLFAPPTVGDMVEVQFPSGDPESGFISQRLYNDIDRPLNVPAGEFWLVHKSGSMLKFHADGSVEIKANAGITSSATSWAHTGNITVTGTLTATTDVVGGGKSLKTHVHSGVQTGGSNTGAPV